MGIDSQTDVAAFLKDHGTAATFDSLTAIRVVFDEAYFETGDQVATTQPIAIAAISDITSADFAVGKPLKIGNKTYMIRNALPDENTTFAELQLEYQGNIDDDA